MLEILNGHKIFVTGMSGYVGSHLVRLMKKKGINPTSIHRCGVSGLQNKEKAAELAWDSLEHLSEILSREDAPILINLAGHFINKHQQSDLLQLIEGNLGFSVMMFDAISKCSNASVINIGTSWELVNSADQLPINLYSCLKASNSLIFRWYCENYGLKGINLKLNDTYGGSDPRNKLIPYLKSFLYEKQIASLGTPFQNLNLLHISDVCEGIIDAAIQSTDYSPGECNSFSLLHTDNITIGDIVQIIKNDVDVEFQVQFKGNGKGETRILNHHSKILPNWQPSISPKAGLIDYFLDTHEYNV